MIKEVIFCTSLFLMLHTYILYPLFLRLMFFIKGPKRTLKGSNDINVSILIAAYNEDTVIEKKLESIMNSEYHIDRQNK